VRVDLYTQTIVALIAFLLAVIAWKPIFQPQAAMAQGGYAEVTQSSVRLLDVGIHNGVAS